VTDVRRNMLVGVWTDLDNPEHVRVYDFRVR